VLNAGRSCTQCVNVGFECKTSDKLSRRAFPRGYTESLEERVRSLEAEVRELRGLLDEKEEKLELLSRVRSHTSPSSTATKVGSPKSAASKIDAAKNTASEDDETFTIVQSPTLAADGETVEANYMGTSSFRSLMSM
jgi:predicted nuclease with TOPRIM domain